jgi:hypothetical protein
MDLVTPRAEMCMRVAAAVALALRSSVASSLAWGARPALHGGMGRLHGIGGGARYGLVKEHHPVGSFGWQVVSSVSMAKGELSRHSASAVRSHPQRVLAIAVGSCGEPRRQFTARGDILMFGHGAVPKCTKRKVCPALPVSAMSAPLVLIPSSKALSWRLWVPH